MNYKLYVMNEEQSRQAQEKAFEMGLEWPERGTVTSHADADFMYFDLDDKHITQTENGDLGYFKDHQFTEITFYEWMAMEAPRKPYEAVGGGV